VNLQGETLRLQQKARCACFIAIGEQHRRHATAATKIDPHGALA